MRWFSRWYGAGPLHLLTMIGCAALAGYAVLRFPPHNAVGIAAWFAGAVIGHDLVLVPLYTLADRSVTAVFRHRAGSLPVVPGVNYLRVPAALSGLLLLIWFPLVLRLPQRYTAATTLPVSPYLWHWLAVTGALFLMSAALFALRLRPRRRLRAGYQRQRQAADEPAGYPPPDYHDRDQYPRPDDYERGGYPAPRYHERDQYPAPRYHDRDQYPQPGEDRRDAPFEPGEYPHGGYPRPGEHGPGGRTGPAGHQPGGYLWPPGGEHGPWPASPGWEPASPGWGLAPDPGRPEPPGPGWQYPADPGPDDPGWDEPAGPDWERH